MNKIRISLENPKIRAIWETVLEARREVASWPAWKRGEHSDAPSSDGTPAPSPPAPKDGPDR
jgi:hypothetical protein